MNRDGRGRSTVARCVATTVMALGSIMAVEMASVSGSAATPLLHARAAGSGTTSPWVGQNMPQPTIPNGDLTSVSCTSAKECEAVGSNQNSTQSLGTLSTEVPLAESWNGVTWKAQAAAVPSGGTASSLAGVSCASAHFCVAVGSQLTDGFSTVPIAEVWTGTTWKLQKLPGGSSQGPLLAVACVTTKSCEAVGTLSLHWNGVSWKAQQLASSKALTSPTLLAVACKATDSCEGVGYGLTTSNVQQPLAELWNGSGWKIQATSVPKGGSGGSFTAGACSSATACEAVGTYLKGANELPFAESWDGKSWVLRALTSPAHGTDPTLEGVACTAAKACQAVGTYTSGSTGLAWAASWNGTAWAARPLAVPSDSQDLAGTAISCVTASACESVGTFERGSDVKVSFGDGWTGKSWALQPAANPAAAWGAHLTGVSCHASDACETVGNFVTSPDNGSTAPFAANWNGKTWALQSLPVSIGSGSALTAVACTGAASCLAVGSLSALWNGKAWKPVSIAKPAGGTSPVLAGVSCSGATSCVAVGQFTGTGGPQPLAEAWNGKDWTAEAPPLPAGTTQSELSGVSCGAARSCEAVGQATKSSGDVVFLAEVWGGTSWTVQSTPNPSGSTFNLLEAVACVSPSKCEAVGNFGSLLSKPTAIAWTGTAWKLQTVPEPSGDSHSVVGLTGVACSAPLGTCKAVGTVADTWSGSAWTSQAPPKSGFLGDAIACVSSTDCEAVGPPAGTTNAPAEAALWK